MPKAKTALQPLQKLSPEELHYHLTGLASMVKANPANAKPLAPQEVRIHLEPLLKHYFRTHNIMETARIIQEKTGYICVALNSTAARWSIMSPGKLRSGSRSVNLGWGGGYAPSGRRIG